MKNILFIAICQTDRKVSLHATRLTQAWPPSAQIICGGGEVKDRLESTLRVIEKNVISIRFT